MGTYQYHPKRVPLVLQTEEIKPLQNSNSKKNRGTLSRTLWARWTQNVMYMHPSGILPQQTQ